MSLATDTKDRFRTALPMLHHHLSGTHNGWRLEMTGNVIHPLPIHKRANVTSNTTYIRAVDDELIHRTWMKYKQLNLFIRSGKSVPSCGNRIKVERMRRKSELSYRNGLGLTLQGRGWDTTRQREVLVLGLPLSLIIVGPLQ
jgi:hypothetical protein